MNIKKNFFYNSVIAVSNYVFPLITFPYVSRVLGPEYLGACNYVDGIVNYCMLFSMLGVATIGMRVVAKYRNNKDMLDSLFTGLLMVSGLSTLVVAFAMPLVYYSMPNLQSYKDIFLIGSTKILFTLFLFEWVFKGLEDFKSITQRTLFVKVAYLLAVILLVKEASDYKLYYFLTACMVALNSIISFFYLRSRIGFKFRLKVVKILLLPVIMMGGYTFLTSMYTTFNVMFLGAQTGVKEVGYYTTSIKLYGLVLSLFTALTAVVSPRMSVLIRERKMDEARNIISKTMEILIAFSFPVILFSVFYAREIIQLVSGAGYEGAVLPMQIVMFLVLIVGVEQVLVLQILVPLQKDVAVLKNAAIGAAVGVVCNLLLVPAFASVGASMVLVLSELTVLALAIFATRRYFPVPFQPDYFLRHLLMALPIVVLYFMVNRLTDHYLVRLLAGGVFALLYFAISQYYILKTRIIVNWVNKLRFKLQTRSMV